MAERTSAKRRKKKGSQELEKPNKLEEAVAKHLRFNLPTKATSIEGTKVEYFTGSKAVDFMLDSKWASGKGKTEILFTDRNSVTKYLDGLLWKGLFYRALKVVKKPKKEGKEKEGKEKEGKEKEGKEEKKKSKKEKKKEAESAGKGEEKEKEEGKETKDGGKEGTPQPKKKDGKKKIKLELTEDQKFVDGNDAFVWVYDPIRPMNYVYGSLLVIGAIAVCLFPLWPPWMRVGTYYTSLGGAGLVGVILGLAVVRLILYMLTWGATFGKIQFWLFPNLLADVGIKESFIPLYECELMTKKAVADNKTDKEKSQDDDNDENGDQSPSEDKPGKETTSQETKAAADVENISQGNRELDEESSSREVQDGAGLINKEGDSQNTDENNAEEEEEEENDDDDDGEDDDDDEENQEEEEEEDDDDKEDSGDGFEVIGEDEISEVTEGSGEE